MGCEKTRVWLARETQKALAAGQLRAGERLAELINHDSGHVALGASELVLKAMGHMPREGAQITINNNAFVGATIRNDTAATERARIAQEILNAPSGPGYLIRLDRRALTEVGGTELPAIEQRKASE